MVMSVNSLSGRIALVTGSSRGIGRAIVEKLSGDGALVVVNYATRAEEAQEVVAAVESAGGQAFAVQADVGRTVEIGRLFDQTIDHYGKLDILVNNAGVLSNAPIAQLKEEDFDRIFAINVKGTLFACQQAAERMTDGGRIINLSSTVTSLMVPTYGVYAASKGAVEQITRVLAKELGARGITVNGVSPGPVDTELFRTGKTEEQINNMAQISPFNRLGQAEDIADVVAFLAREDSRWISGQNIRVNGAFA
jgi:3-oxoacyl-[acyl-carrier protein] reductase